MTVGTIAQVDPTTLTIAMNVRTDAKVDKEFVASIKQLGILQPPMVTPNADGGYDVVLGQRRTLAAVEAGLKTIPVYVVDQSEADAARVVDQLTENDQRQGLSEVERVAGYKQLSLFGLSPAQIVKRTARPKAVIEKALAVAGDEVASAALAEHELTLDEAAYLVEFSDDKAAVKKLVTAAGEGKLPHVVASLREERELQAAVVEQEDLLKAIVGAKHVLPFTKQTWQEPAEPAGLVALTRLGKPSDPTELAEPKDVPKKLLYGQVIVSYQDVGGSQYKYWPSPRFFVLNPEENGIPRKEWADRQPRELTPEEQEAEAVRKAEREAEQQKQAALVAASTVRRAWLVEFLQRKKLPEVLPFMVNASLTVRAEYDLGTCELLGIPMPEDAAEETMHEVFRSMVDADPAKAERVLLAAFLAGAEGKVDADGRMDSYYGPKSEVIVLYLPQLAEWGYGLSDAEQALLTEAVAVRLAEAADEDAGEDVDEGAFDDDEDETDDAA